MTLAALCPSTSGWRACRRTTLRVAEHVRGGPHPRRPAGARVHTARGARRPRRTERATRTIGIGSTHSWPRPGSAFLGPRPLGADTGVGASCSPVVATCWDRRGGSRLFPGIAITLTRGVGDGRRTDPAGARQTGGWHATLHCRCGGCGSPSTGSAWWTTSPSHSNAESASRSSGSPARGSRSRPAHMLGLTPAEATVSLEGLLIDGRDAARGSPNVRRRDLRGAGIALVSKDALVSLDPLAGSGRRSPSRCCCIGSSRDVRRWRGGCRSSWRGYGCPTPERRSRQHPHELSGGLRQRALIALRTRRGPAVLVGGRARRPALDATVQGPDPRTAARDHRCRYPRSSSSVMTSPRFAGIADRVLVMKDGIVVESGTVSEVLEEPPARVHEAAHPPRRCTSQSCGPHGVLSPVLIARGLSRSFATAPAVHRRDVHGEGRTRRSASWGSRGRARRHSRA